MQMPKFINNGEITIDGAYAIGMLAKGAKIANTGKISSTSIKNGTGIVGIGNSTVDNVGSVKVLGTGLTNNIGVFLKETNGTATGTTATGVTPEVEVSGDNSTGVLMTGTAKTLTMKGNVKASGNAVTGIIADGTSTVTLSGTSTITVNNGTDYAGKATVKVKNAITGLEEDVEKGSYGIVVNPGSTFTGTATNVDANVTTDKSIGLFSAGNLTVNKANIKTSDGAINFFAKGGEININGGGATETGQKSLLFYTSNSGKVDRKSVV